MADDLVEKLRFCANLHPQCGYPENGKLFGAAAERITALEDHARALVEALRPFGFVDEDGGDVQKAWEMRYRDRFEDWIDFADIECARAALEEHQKIMEGK